MELLALEIILAAAKEGSARVAAGRVFRTEPAVRIAFSRLEEGSETPTFDRSKRHSIGDRGYWQPAVR